MVPATVVVVTRIYPVLYCEHKPRDAEDPEAGQVRIMRPEAAEARAAAHFQAQQQVVAEKVLESLRPNSENAGSDRGEWEGQAEARQFQADQAMACALKEAGLQDRQVRFAWRSSIGLEGFYRGSKGLTALV